MSTPDFSQFLRGLTPAFTPVIDPSFKKEDYTPIDLSPDNKKLSEDAVASSESFCHFMNRFIKDSGAKVAYGGYRELRKLYRRSDLFTASRDEELNRNIHLGMDIWADAGTKVLAALDGTVHSFKDNTAFGDYGPTIILEHNIGGRTFYTLYGHLSRKSLEDLAPGQKLNKGELLGWLGAPFENGDYAPHLHFQVMRDLEGRAGDYPGVACQKELDHFLSNCPDPNLLLKIGEEGS